MSPTPQPATSNGGITETAKLADVQVIAVEWDQPKDVVTVCPGCVPKGKTVCFQNPKGGKVRIAFLSPEGHETDTVLDSETCAMTIGGIYHFRCYFTLPGATHEVTAKTGGVLEVLPPRP